MRSWVIATTLVAAAGLFTTPQGAARATELVGKPVKAVQIVKP